MSKSFVNLSSTVPDHLCVCYRSAITPLLQHTTQTLVMDGPCGRRSRSQASSEGNTSPSCPSVSPDVQVALIYLGPTYIASSSLSHSKHPFVWNFYLLFLIFPLRYHTLYISQLWEPLCMEESDHNCSQYHCRKIMDRPGATCSSQNHTTSVLALFDMPLSQNAFPVSINGHSIGRKIMVL